MRRGTSDENLRCLSYNEKVECEGRYFRSKSSDISSKEDVAMSSRTSP